MPRGLRRGGAVLAAAALAVGCVTPRGPTRTVDPSKPRAILAVPASCCRPENLRALRALERALGRRARVQTVKLSPATRDSVRGTARQVARIRADLKRAQEQYLSMRMDRARLLLEGALVRARRMRARGLSPRELAQIHMVLAAVSHAEHRPQDVQRHSQAAVGLFPDIAPDEDAYSPPVRAAVEKARKDRSSLKVVLRSSPAGGVATWDGQRRGETPTSLPAQARGEHYLIVEHPLHRPWSDVITLSTDAQLQVTLKPWRPPRILSVLRNRPELRGQGLALLKVDAAVSVIEGAGGLEVQALTRAATREAVLSPPSPGPAAEELAILALPAGPTSVPAAASRPAPPERRAEPSRWRRYWWALALVGAAAVATAIAVPVALSGGDDVDGRGVRLDLP